MSKSYKKSRSEEIEYEKQRRLRDSQYLYEMRKEFDRRAASMEGKLAEYLRLKGELE